MVGNQPEDGKLAHPGSTIEFIRAAIDQGLPVSFRYERSDGMIARHNAVYPKEVFRQGQHTLCRAYCHFTRDSRVFRIDRIHAIRLRTPLRGIPSRYGVLGFIVALALIIAIFALLIFLSPKYRWRKLRNQIFGAQSTIEQIEAAEFNRLKAV